MSESRIDGPKQQGCAILYIDLDALVANWRAIAAAVVPAKAAAVVKSDAYGIGALPVVRALAAAGCRHFFVAQLSEAIKLKGVLPKDGVLYVLNGLMPGAESACADAGAVPVLNSLNQIERWSAYARAQRETLPAILQVDTGMSRLGLPPEEVEILLAERHRLDGVALQYVMSHLACADDPGNPAIETQRTCFERIASAFPDVARSFDNSGGALISAVPHYDLVRPGIALYGGAAHSDFPAGMRPVVRLDASIIQLRRIPAGTGVGYGLTFTATRDTFLATLAVGYADGWPWQLGNRGSAYVAGIRTPIVGRVSMDSMVIDVTDVPLKFLVPGAPVELIGPHQSLEDIASDAGTIAYEILTRLGARYERVYHGSHVTLTKEPPQ